MLALEIHINGKKSLVAGSPDWASVFTHIFAYKTQSGNVVQMDVGVGLEQKEPGKLENLRWNKLKITEHDEILLRFVQTDVTDEPSRRYRSDRNVQESPYTEDEKRDIRYKDYLELKEEFERDG
jgi:hypothetical protein